MRVYWTSIFSLHWHPFIIRRCWSLPWSWNKTLFRSKCQWKLFNDNRIAQCRWYRRCFIWGRHSRARSGTLSQTSDHLDSLSFCITSALTYSFRDSNTCFLTIGNSPGYTSGIKRTASDRYYVFDSHSRDDQGRCSPSGKAIVLQINSMVQLVKYVKDMSQSISSTSNKIKTVSKTH